jgi:dihydroxy-acid dehydratase
VPKSQTPWQDIHRSTVTQMADGQVIRGADRYQRVAQKSVPRDNH